MPHRFSHHAEVVVSALQSQPGSLGHLHVVALPGLIFHLTSLASIWRFPVPFLAPEFERLVTGFFVFRV